MAKKAMKVKQQRKQKFSSREYSRCKICGRPHAYLSGHRHRYAVPAHPVSLLFCGVAQAGH